MSVGHQFHAVVSLLFGFKAQQQPLEFIFPREVRSTHSRNEWMAALNNRFRPRFGVFRLRGFSLTFGTSPASKIALVAPARGEAERQALAAWTK
jgi:hypothetical protein